MSADGQGEKHRQGEGRVGKTTRTLGGERQQRKEDGGQKGEWVSVNSS